MAFQISRSIDVLERTPPTLHAMLSGIDDFWGRANYGVETFSPFDVVGHLLEGEKHDWMVRARLILDHGQARAFEPFDRYAMYTTSRGKSMNDLLNEFADMRAKNLTDLRSLDLTPAALNSIGRHPALGPVTLRNLLATWVVHDLGHIHQIAKSMAFQYRNEVGPWVEYLTILPRPSGPA